MLCLYTNFFRAPLPVGCTCSSIGIGQMRAIRANKTHHRCSTQRRNCASKWIVAHMCHRFSDRCTIFWRAGAAGGIVFRNPSKIFYIACTPRQVRCAAGNSFTASFRTWNSQTMDNCFCSHMNRAYEPRNFAKQGLSKVNIFSSWNPSVPRYLNRLLKRQPHRTESNQT